MRFLFLSLLPLFLNAIQIKIASYNVENLFDMVNNGTEYDAYIPNRHNWKRSTLKKKLLNISEVICDINADIIGLQEVENENALKLLQKSLRDVGCHYGFSAITHKPKSAIQVALLSKLPIKNIKEIVVNRKLSNRNILEVKLLIEGNPLYIFVNHWRSKQAPESKRIRSARALKNRLEQLPKGLEYILLGDFNSDYDEYREMEPKHNDTGGKTGINHTLKTVLNGKIVREEVMKGKSRLHYNLWLELPNFQRWSHNFYGNRQGLDAILLPYTMFNGKGIDYVNDTFNVVKASYLFHKKGYIHRWQYKRNRHLGKGYSDHLPIVATFSTNPYHFQKRKSDLNEGTIENLYKGLKEPLLLKSVRVIFKSKYHAIVKQHPWGRAIFVYGANGLEKGHLYDMVVDKIKVYRGLHEIISFRAVYDYGEGSFEEYFYRGGLDFSNEKLENEVVREVTGRYRNGNFYLKGKGYKIYFKNRALKPKNGTRLKLHRVQIGYYDEMQLVVWGAEDFTILE
jgi:endonuclease/exonuclease/phosphatase family metal-dependent hydrolase